MLLLGLVALACLLATSIGYGAPAPADLNATLDPSAPHATLFGASPGEAPGEVWGTAGGEIVRYSDASGWQSLPEPAGLSGTVAFPAGPLEGRASVGGDVVLFATDATGQRLLTRSPGGSFTAAPAPGALLGPGSTLFPGGGGTPLLAGVTEAGGGAGAVLVPSGSGPPGAVLDYDGSAWASEPICVGTTPVPCQAPGAGFTVLGIDATTPGNAWLLARDPAAGSGVELYKRDPGSATWRLQSLGPGLGSLYSEASPSLPGGATVEVVPRAAGQPLTVTAQGVWVDAELTTGGTGTDATFYYDIGAGSVLAAWCDGGPTLAPLCPKPLGSGLPRGGSRSFACPPDGGGGDPYGTRTITGVGQGALLVLEGESFARVPTVGGDAGVPGAALGAPEEGWLSSSRGSIHLTREQQQEPAPGGLQAWPVPDIRPLLAVAGESGSPVGEPDSEAIAVGEAGAIFRYSLENGWTAEPVRGSGPVPRFRAVAWPARYGPFAVGDDGAMWVGLRGTAKSPEWEPDGGEPPGIENVDLTGIAFTELGGSQQPSANRVPGWVVGTDGTLLGFAASVRQWEKYAVPEGVNPKVDFSSVAFAGNEALATYKRPLPGGGFGADGGADGGLLVNEGSGWKVDQGALEALGNAVPEKVAGLPDGGAVVASLDGKVIEREGPGSPWTAAPPGTEGYPAALAAFREGGQVRAAISVGSAPDPYKPPINAYLLRQSADGWRDEQHETFPLPSGPQESANLDYPLQPDAVLGLILDPKGDAGWAVGGQTGEIAENETNREEIQTAAIMRYPAQGAPDPIGVAKRPIQPGPGVNFMIGGGAQCAGPCADLAGTGIGPDRAVSHAFEQAAEIKGMRAIIYTGAGVADGLSRSLDPSDYARESSRYAARLAGAAGTTPVFAAPAPSDLNRAGSLSTFAESFAGFGAPFGTAAPGAGIAPVSDANPGQEYYAFDSDGKGGSVRVIVLDYAAPKLGATQRCWLARQLFSAGEEETPAIVVGNRDFNPEDGAPGAAEDDPLTDKILLGIAGTEPGGCSVFGGGSPTSDSPAASAYFFDYPGQNRIFNFEMGGRTLPVIGSGALGYIEPPDEEENGFRLSGSTPGYLLASVDVSHVQAGTNMAPVNVQVIPAVGQLALTSLNGTGLVEGGPELFVPIVRQPLAGMRCGGYPACSFSPEPYRQTLTCPRPNCGSELPAFYTFESSNPEVAQFVVAGEGSSGSAEMLFPSPPGAPIESPSAALLCPLRPGVTTVTASAGGVSRSLTVVVSQDEQRGDQCGFEILPAAVPEVTVPGLPASTPSPLPGPAPLTPAPALPVPAAQPPAPQAAQPPGVPTPIATPVPAPVPVILPVPSPPIAQVIPPSPALPATLPAPAPAPVPVSAPSAVPAPALAPQDQQEAAFDVVHNMAAIRREARAPAALSAYHPSDEGLSPLLLYSLPALGALAALGLTAAVRSAPRVRRSREALSTLDR